MKPVATAVNTAWWASSALGWRRFERALRRPDAVQRRILTSYLESNARTAFGRRYRFSEIRTVRQFQDCVPLTTYDDYRTYVERIGAGETEVLTQAPVRLLEPTSGSTSAAKLVPYTDDLRREFAHAIAPWTFEWFRSDPSLLGGPAYWSITPALRRVDLGESAVRIGFNDDADYLGGRLSGLVRHALVVPPEIGELQDPAAFRHVTALLLLACAELRLISVWHPSFLSLLVETIRNDWQLLIETIRRGRLHHGVTVGSEVETTLRRRLRADPRRAAWLESVGPETAGRLWPRLRLISCWADGHAAATAGALQREFPQARIEPKGLLATEACVTFPRRDAQILAIRSHFFEFLDDRGNAHLAHELHRGETYSVVVTTGGGLYRYRLNDLVDVRGFVGETPELRFTDKEDHVVDRFGEKLHAGFVAGLLHEVLDGIDVRFAMLAPESEEDRTFYVLYLETTHDVPHGLGPSLESALCANPHYRYCVELGQLQPLRLFQISNGGFESYAERCTGAGQRLGDLKAAPLDTRTGWSEWFRGHYADEPVEYRQKMPVTN